MSTLISGDVRPTTGDLVLARVEALGKQTKLELTDGRRAHLFPGDEIVVSYGNRYAPDQFEAIVADDLAPCDLVAAGGIAGVELSRHVRMLPPTKITPVGLIGDGAGERINLAQFRVDAAEQVPDLPVVLSLGTSMNAGKTLTSTALVRGFKRLGLRAAALKITGTGAGGDMWIVRDAGADVALDFTDAGFASTYLVPIEEVVAGAFRLINYAAAVGCAVAVIEIADGLQQKETAQLVRNDALRALTLGCTFAAYDSMGAILGFRELVEAGHTVLGLSGRLGMSPLGVREAEAATGLRVYSPWDLQDGVLVPAIQRRAAQAFAASRFRRHSLLALAQAAMSCEPAEAANGHDLRNGCLAAPPPGQTVADLARDVLAGVAEHLMEQEVAALCGGAAGSRAAGRTNRRNGFRRVVWDSSLGAVDLKVPRLRHGGYTPSFLDAVVEPGKVEAVLRATDAAKGEDALLRLLRALGGPTLGRADALSVGSRIGHLISAPGLSAPSGPEAVAMAGLPLSGAWPESDDSDINAIGVEDEEAPDFADGHGEMPLSAERAAQDIGRALALRS
jgi:hypothetical protein